MPTTNTPRTPEQRAEIARQNGAKSHGPKTEAGKAKVSRNALKHGFAADKHHVTDDEDFRAYSQFHDAAAPSTWMPTPSTSASRDPRHHFDGR